MHVHAGIAFGAGAYRCPGRFFAEMEVALLVQLILARRNFTILSAPSSTPNGAQQVCKGGAVHTQIWVAKKGKRLDVPG
eukprot:1153806-Pelagomonas_calceolata.AAC.5